MSAGSDSPGPIPRARSHVLTRRRRSGAVSQGTAGEGGEVQEKEVERRSSVKGPEGRTAEVEGVEYTFVSDIPSDCLCFLCGQVRDESERRAGGEEGREGSC